MRRSFFLPAGFLSVMIAVAVFASAQQEQHGPALTIYNQDFAVVRQNVPLDLHAGVNNITYNDITAHLEPDSVVLRDPSGQPLNILEQNYRNDPVSQGLLLSLYEGKSIDFDAGRDAQGHPLIVQGKIVRSGYTPPGLATNGSNEPLIEVNGQLQFQLPGKPLFPALTADSILKPRLEWQIGSPRSGNINAELGYITSGLSWHADYNLVAPANGDALDIIGWITLQNDSGKQFTNAQIKLMAGNVNKFAVADQIGSVIGGIVKTAEAAPAVQEKAFDEYHLYTLPRATTLRDQETKQMEFIRAAGVKSTRVYIYDGSQLRTVNEYQRTDPNIGAVTTNTKINVYQEFKNSKENHLGIPLPAGRMRFYRKDSDGQLEFTGENEIDHTPADEMVRVYTGDAFDIIGGRKRTNFRVSTANHTADESFEITLRNHKKTPVNVRVVEHLYRWSNWEITQHSDAFTKKDAQTVEFPVDVPADGEKTITYTVHYSW